jgi:hypothetical protein
MARIGAVGDAVGRPGWLERRVRRVALVDQPPARSVCRRITRPARRRRVASPVAAGAASPGSPNTPAGEGRLPPPAGRAARLPPRQRGGINPRRMLYQFVQSCRRPTRRSTPRQALPAVGSENGAVRSGCSEPVATMCGYSRRRGAPQQPSIVRRMVAGVRADRERRTCPIGARGTRCAATSRIARE